MITLWMNACEIVEIAVQSMLQFMRAYSIAISVANFDRTEKYLDYHPKVKKEIVQE